MTPPAITVEGPEYAKRVAEVISAAFSTSSFTAYLLRKPGLTWPTDNIPADVVGPHFRKNVTTRVGLGVELVEAGDFAAVAVWFPPGVSISTDGIADAKILDYLDSLVSIRKEHLQGRKHWYLNLIWRHPQRTEPGGSFVVQVVQLPSKITSCDLTGTGAVRAVIEPYMEKAREQGVPLWLEAINDHARDVYQRFGSRIVAEVHVGAGMSNSRGELYESGRGLLAYAMMAG
ncbi:hypothetical protein BDW69DRAFT_190496 [Aspergillus filifer]